MVFINRVTGVGRVGRRVRADPEGCLCQKRVLASTGIVNHFAPNNSHGTARGRSAGHSNPAGATPVPGQLITNRYATAIFEKRRTGRFAAETSYHSSRVVIYHVFVRFFQLSNGRLTPFPPADAHPAADVIVLRRPAELLSVFRDPRS